MVPTKLLIKQFTGMLTSLSFMPKKSEDGRSSRKKTKRVSIKTRLVKEHREKIKKLKRDLRDLERDYRSLTGRRKRIST